MPILSILLILTTNQKCTNMSCLLTIERQRAVWHPASVLPIHCLYVLHYSYYVLVVLACWEVFSLIFGPRYSSLVQTIQIITSQVCLHKLQAADMKILIRTQQQYLHHRELSRVGDLVDEGMIFEMLEVFIKELNVVAAK